MVKYVNLLVCGGDKCGLKYSCLRYLAIDKTKIQTMIKHNPEKCQNYISIKSYKGEHNENI